MNKTKEGPRITARRLAVSDVSVDYVRWLNDPDVTRFISADGQTHTMDSVTDYVRSFETRKDALLYGIFDKNTGGHIGNFTITHIDQETKTATVGICIGKKNYWGRGYASEALETAKKVVFEEMGFSLLKAGVCVTNESSKKLFERSGFTIKETIKSGAHDRREKLDALIYILDDQSYRTSLNR